MKRKKIVLQHDIRDSGYPTNDLGYFSGHFEASLNEIEKHGIKHFDRLSQEINRDIPEGELAGDHIHGKIEVSSRIPRHPKWMRKEIQDHEFWESQYMRD